VHARAQHGQGHREHPDQRPAGHRVQGDRPVEVAKGRAQPYRPEQQEDAGIEQLPGLLGQERRLLGMVAATILNVIPATKAAMNLLPSAAAAV
jgi:hypothetical protein